MITVTDNAASQIAKLIEKQHPEATGLRVGVKAGGCSGFEYVFAWEPAPGENHLVFDGPHGVRVWIDPRSLRLLDGTTLDYDTLFAPQNLVQASPASLILRYRIRPQPFAEVRPRVRPSQSNGT